MSNSEKLTNTVPPLNIINSDARKPHKTADQDLDHNLDLEESRSKQGADHDTGPVAKAEIGGPKGPEPTRYGDWERKGRCVDF